MYFLKIINENLPNLAINKKSRSQNDHFYNVAILGSAPEDFRSYRPTSGTYQRPSRGNRRKLFIRTSAYFPEPDLELI